MIKKSLKMIGIVILSIVMLILIVGVLFINISPEFGGKPSKDQIESYKKSGHYEDGKFVNLVETNMDMNFKSMVNLFVEFVKGNPNGRPKKDLPVIEHDSLEIAENKSRTRLIWFGHSAFLLQLDGKNILIDPMFGNVPAPNPLLGGKRYSKELPLEIKEIPQIDAIILSHDHYDHLDYGSIQKLKSKTKDFFVPLGVGAHFIEWGIPAENVHEMNWWDETKIGDIKLAFTPSRHFSGRGLTDRNSTLWGSWVIKGVNDNIYFSGDGGYGTHFKEIGEKYGPFDFALMECGQYNVKWQQIHMLPEETAQAALDVQTKVMMPIHWAAFTLALHDWNEPAIRVSKKAKELNLPLLIPKIGASIWLDSLDLNQEVWWKN